MPGSHEAPFRPKMTARHHSCIQSIRADFIGIDCLPTPGQSMNTEQNKDDRRHHSAKEAAALMRQPLCFLFMSVSADPNPALSSRERDLNYVSWRCPESHAFVSRGRLESSSRNTRDLSRKIRAQGGEIVFQCFFFSPFIVREMRFLSASADRTLT